MLVESLYLCLAMSAWFFLLQCVPSSSCFQAPPLAFGRHRATVLLLKTLLDAADIALRLDLSTLRAFLDYNCIVIITKKKLYAK